MNEFQRLAEVRDQLSKLDPNNRDHLAEIARLKQEEVELVKPIKAQIEYLEVQEQEILNHDTINADELNLVRNRLSELQFLLDSKTAPTGQVTEQEAEPAIPQRTPFEFINKFNFDEYAKFEGNTLNSIVQSLLNAKNSVIEQLQATNGQLQSELEGTKEQVVNLEFQNKEIQSKLQLVTEEKNQYKLEAEDYKSRFHAAAEQLTEKDTENERLKRREGELQEQIARAQAPTARQIIDITPEPLDLDSLIAQANEQKRIKAEQEEAERKAKLIRVTNIRWEDPNNRKLRLAELVLDGPTGEDPVYGLIGETGKAGDTIRFHDFTRGKYLEVSNEEARFLRDQTQTDKATPVQDIPLDAQPVEVPVIPEVTFHAEVGPMETHTSADTQVAGQDHVTREEFEALKADVEVLKRRQGMVA